MSCSCLPLSRLLLTLTSRGNPFLSPTVVAYGVVPLKQLVLAHNAKQAWTTLKLNLELNGLPAGAHVAGAYRTAGRVWSCGMPCL